MTSKVLRAAMLATLSWSWLSPTWAATLDGSTAFAQKAAALDAFEIQSSKLALSKSQSMDIKLFAQKILDEQKRADDKLKAAAVAGKVHILPTMMTDIRYKKPLFQLSRRNSAKDFDKLYLEEQLSAHSDAVALFESYASKGDNAALKSYATGELPLLKKQQQMLDQMQVK